MRRLILTLKEIGPELRCSPWVPPATIEAFLREKEEWILHQLERLPKAYDPYEGMPWLGERLPMRIEIDPSRKIPLMRLEGDFLLLLTAKRPDREELRELYEKFYRRHAPERLTPLVEAWSKKTGLVPTRVSYRKNRSLWGSCSARNALSLNTRLLTCPIPLQEYVVLHELCHIRQKNHSPAFWKLVGGWMPDWREHRKELRSYEIFLR